jgi:carboxylesterase type B
MIHKIIKNSIRRQIRNSLSFMLPEIKVKVNQGIVKGVIESLPDGRKFQRFSGIPYAKPPIGKLRFRAPQKLMKFDKDEIDCSKEGNQCVHKSLFYNTYVGSEDCLNLNVYVPNDNVDKIAKLPVMVFTHGGAFAFGSNNRDL